MSNLRYPGTKPFSKGERHLFFGRENDIEQLYSLVTIEPIVVLFGKSGLGKSSLINAGITPILEEKNYKVTFIRFGNKFSENEDTLHNIFIQRTRHNQPLANYLDKITAIENSFWYIFKARQLHERINTQNLIVFDQFEEIFTYTNEVEEFARNLAELLSPNIPLRYRLAFQEKMQYDADLLTNEEIDTLYKPLSIKILISIRSDMLSLLNRLAIYIPGILKKCYELSPLSADMAKNAIMQPALLPENFASPVFTYTPRLLDFIIQYLSGTHTNSIESFQLQLVCDYFEKKSIEIRKKDKHIKIEFDDVKSIRDEIPNITIKFYENIIKSFPANLQRTISVFIEEGLILEEERRRLSLYKGQIIKNFSISEEVLNHLVDKRIIRAETNSSNLPYYELSHDTLIEPVLLAKRYRILNEENERLRQEFEEKQKLDAQMYSLEKARELAKLDKKGFELSTSAAIKKKHKFYLSQLKLKETKAYIRSIYVFILFFLFVIVCAVWSVVATIKVINKQNRINATVRKVENANNNFQKLLNTYDSSQGQITYKQLKDLYFQYRNIQP